VQNVSETPISTNKKLGVVSCTCHPSYMESVDRRIIVLAGRGIKERPYLKNKAKRVGSVAQVVEHLPSKCKAVSSNPCTRGKKKFIHVLYF
jgi:hypothetical protein